MRPERPRRLSWEGTLNARDLGGYPTADGRATRWAAFVRCDSLAALSPQGCASVLEHGVRTVIDLRFPDEVRQQPNPFATHPDISYHHVSVIDPSSMPSIGTTLADNYVETLDRFRGQIGRVLQIMADADEGTVLFHCREGKDRTGVIAALLLGLAGVPREVIAEDYALSADLLQPRFAEMLASGDGTREQREADMEWWRPRVEVMDDVLRRLESAHGSVEGYVLSAGVSAEQVERLRQRLVDAGGD